MVVDSPNWTYYLISFSPFQPVLHDWYLKDSVVCYTLFWKALMKDLLDY